MKDIPQFVLKKYEEYKSKSEAIKSKDNLRLDDKSESKIIQPNIINEEQYFSNFIGLFCPRLDVKREFIEISRNPLTDLGITVGLLNENDFYEWKLSILGPKDTSYKEGLFYLNIKFPLDYPKSHPDIRFITPIYHMNIKPTKESSNKISPPKLYFREPCEIKIILINLYSIFYWQNYKNPLCSNELVEEYLKKRDIYEDKIKFFTKKYANPDIPYIEYKENEENWNFDNDEFIKNKSEFIKKNDLNEEKNDLNNSAPDDKGYNLTVIFVVKGRYLPMIENSKKIVNTVLEKLSLKLNYSDFNINRPFLAITNSQQVKKDKTLEENKIKNWQKIFIITDEVIFL